MTSRLPRIGLVALLATALACGLYTAFNAVQRARISHSLDYEEGNVLNAAVRINHGLTPYPDPQSWPVVLNPYGPIPYYLAAIPVHFAGPQLFGPRLIVVFATILCAIFLALIIWTETQSTMIAAAFGALFVSQTVVQFWMPILRVDLIGLAFELAGLWAFLRIDGAPETASASLLCRRAEQGDTPTGRGRFALMIPAVLFTAAIFTKPTFIAAPAACLVYLLLRKRNRQALQFALSGIGFCGLAFVFMQVSTHSAFAFDVLKSHPDPIVWSHLKTFFRYLLFSNPLLVIVATIGLARILKQRDFSLPAIYSVFATVLVTGTILKLGSNDNHLLEMVAALILLAAIATDRLARWNQVAGLAICALLAIWCVLQLPFTPVAEPISGCRDAYTLIAQQPTDRILAEDTAALVISGKSVWVSNPYLYAQLANAGKLSDAQLQQRVNSRWFDLIILENEFSWPSERWSPAVRVAISRNYHLATRFPCKQCRFFYVPNQR